MSRRASGSRLMTKAGLGVGMSSVLLLLFEIFARLGLGAPPEPPGLWQRWDSRRPSFEIEDAWVTTRYQDRSEPTIFSTHADPSVPRVVFMGGSTMHGGSRIATELEIPAAAAGQLAERGTPIEALNLGNPGLDSHDIRQLAIEALAFEPRLLVIYTGHNDLGNTLQEQRYGSFGGALQVRMRLLLWHSRAYLMLRDLLVPQASVGEATRRRPQPGSTEQVMNPSQRLLAAEALERNLAAIAVRAAEHDVGLVLVTPISNWLMCPPIGRGCPEARGIIDLEAYGSRPLPRHEHPNLEQALSAYPDCAELLHARGRARFDDGAPGASDDLRRALETDPSPMRANAAMVDAVRSAARDNGAGLVDLEAVVLEQHGVPPRSWFLDCLHYSPEGHASVGGLVAQAIETQLASTP